MALFRYPGGKTKLLAPILAGINSVLSETGIDEVREPFFGGGSVGLAALEKTPGIRSLHLNDKNIALAALWTAIIRHPADLIQRIQRFTPTVEAFYEFKRDLLEPQRWSEDRQEMVELGFKELAIHQTSFSGLGTKSGGPLGGRSQACATNRVGSRWSPERLSQRVAATHQLFNTVSITSGRCTADDFSCVFQDGKPACLYLDPPYFEMGGDLYQHAFAEADHLRLADLLKHTHHPWILSYDNCDAIRDLYAGWSNLQEIAVNYTMNGSHTKSELLITPITRRIYWISLPAAFQRSPVEIR